jgi:peptide/nickel transport system substrate-binding protein
VAVGAYTTAGDPAVGVALLFTCEEKPVIFGNPTGYCREDVDRLFTDAQQQTNFQDRNKIYRRLQAILAGDLPVLPFVSTISADVYATRFVFDDPRGPGPALTDSFWSGWEYVHKAK